MHTRGQKLAAKRLAISQETVKQVLANDWIVDHSEESGFSEVLSIWTTFKNIAKLLILKHPVFTNTRGNKKSADDPALKNDSFVYLNVPLELNQSFVVIALKKTVASRVCLGCF